MAWSMSRARRARGNLHALLTQNLADRLDRACLARCSSMNATINGVGVEFPGEENRRVLKDRVCLTQLTVLPLQPAHPLRLARSHALALTPVDLRLPHPAAERLGTEPESLRNRLARSLQVQYSSS